jgi:shikimate kinase
MKLIFLYGPPASGKYTIAKLLAEKMGYKLFHNHLTVDLLRSVFEFGAPGFFELSRKMRLQIFEEAARQNIPGIVFTYVYEKDEDDPFIREVLEKVTAAGGEVKFVQIYCEKEELLKRVKEESRKEFRKIKTEEGLLQQLKEDITSPILFVDSVKVDTTHLSVAESLAKVMEAIKEKSHVLGT